MRSVLLLTVACALLSTGCKRSRPAAPSPEEGRLAPVEVTKEGKWLYTHVTAEGGFATVEDLAAIPEGARRVVRVVDPTRNALERRDTTMVYVLDAGELLARGKATARPMSREAFETAAVAQLPPGQSSLLADRPAQPPEAEASADGGTRAAEGFAVVTIYGTSWCGACKAARKFLTERKVPFADKDIERDPAAARELAEKAARLGVPADRVPILDVRGRLLVGFDPVRLQAMLGEAT